MVHLQNALSRFTRWSEMLGPNHILVLFTMTAGIGATIERTGEKI